MSLRLQRSVCGAVTVGTPSRCRQQEGLTIRTYLDLIDRLRAYVGNDGSDLKSAAVIRAAAEAVQSISQKADWNYYKTVGLFTGSVPYSTGTIEFDFTGGTYERQVTLTGGTWPDWAQYGTVAVNNVPYDVSRRISSTVLTLKENSSPSSDIAAGTIYQIYRTRYPLPSNFVSMHKPVINSQYTQLGYVTYDQFLTRRNFNDGPGQPSMFTVIDDGLGQKQVQIWNPPDQAYAFQYEYKRKPVLPVVVDESTGKISLTAASVNVTGVSTMFTQAMNSAVLRVSYDQKKPTAFDSINPPQSEHVIEAVSSTTALELTEAAAQSAASRGYTISSRVDVADGPMFHYLVHLGMKNLRIYLRINMVQGEIQDYERAEREAKDADGQNYTGTDRAVVSQCRVGYGRVYGSYTRQIPGNG